jgi:S1-C subfamily serine protease
MRQQQAAGRLRAMDARMFALALAIGSAARAAVTLPSDTGTAWKEIADRLHSTVIEVHGQIAAENVSYGTGVLIGNKLAVTTLHAVAMPSGNGKMTPLQDVQVVVPEVGPMEAHVIAGAPEIDLAILALPDGAASLEAAPLATEVPEQGDALVAMGTGDDTITVLGVIVSGVDGDLFGLVSKRMIDSRFWGGPLFDSQGRLAGIHLTSIGPSRAISARVIQRLLDERSTLANPASSP